LQRRRIDAVDRLLERMQQSLAKKEADLAHRSATGAQPSSAEESEVRASLARSSRVSPATKTRPSVRQSPPQLSSPCSPPVRRLQPEIPLPVDGLSRASSPTSRHRQLPKAPKTEPVKRPF
jgi:hypothetical protein